MIPERDILQGAPPEMEPVKSQKAPFPWPDFGAQQREIFGDRVLSAGTIQELMNEERD